LSILFFLPDLNTAFLKGRWDSLFGPFVIVLMLLKSVCSIFPVLAGRGHPVAGDEKFRSTELSFFSLFPSQPFSSRGTFSSDSNAFFEFKKQQKRTQTRRGRAINVTSSLVQREVYDGGACLEKRKARNPKNLGIFFFADLSVEESSWKAPPPNFRHPRDLFLFFSLPSAFFFPFHQGIFSPF